MQGSMVDVATADGIADSYLTGPPGGGAHPGVLIAMDAPGLRPQLKLLADRIASWGYVVLAPNLFYREGRAPVLPLPDLRDPERRAEFIQSVLPVMARLTPQLTVRDGAGYLDYLSGVAPGPVAISGYCMGVRAGVRIAAEFPDRVAALGGFHGGGLVTGEPDSPHLLAGRLRAKLYFGHADNDASMTAEDIATLERALHEAGADYRSELYEGAPHGYVMADSAAYDKAASERHFDELSALLKRATV